MGIDGNEKTYKLEEGSKLEQTTEHPHGAAKKTINWHLKEGTPKGRDMDDNLSRKQQVEISRLSSSNYPELR